MGSMRSVQFQIVPCSSLYFFSKSIGPFQCLVNVNYRVLICCTCHFQSGYFFFAYFGSSVCMSLPCLISALTQGGESGQLFRLTCSGVLWGGRDPANKYLWHVWKVLQHMDHTGFTPAQGGVCFPGLHCSVFRVHFPGLSHSGFWVI